MNIKEIIPVLEKYDQMHLIKYFNELSSDEQEELINQIKSIDFEHINNIYINSLNKKDIESDRISSIDYYSKDELNQDYYKNIKR